MSESTSTTVVTNQPTVAIQATKKPTTVREWLSDPSFQDQIGRTLPKHMTPDRMIRVALTALTRTPKLADCTPASVCKCMLDLSAMGLEPDGRRAHLIPFGKECTLVVDYRGKAELAMRSGLVATIHADVVCNNDFFEADTGRVRHRVNYKEPRGKVYAAYCMVRFKDDTEKAEVLTLEEIEGIRSRSRSGQVGPWKTDFNEMAKKTAAHRVFKWVPLSPEIRDAMEADDDAIDIKTTPIARAEPLSPFQLPESSEAAEEAKKE